MYIITPVGATTGNTQDMIISMVMNPSTYVFTKIVFISSSILLINVQ